MPEPKRAPLTIKSRSRADGSVTWSIYIRRPRPERDELIPVPGYTKLTDRAAVEAYAAPYRKALNEGARGAATRRCNGVVRALCHAAREARPRHGAARGDWARYVASFVGNKPVASITADDLKASRDNLTTLRLDGKISAARAMNVWSTVVKAPLSRAFTDDDPKYSSVRVGPFAANPAMGIKPPVDNADKEEDARPSSRAKPLACSHPPRSPSTPDASTRGRC